MRIAPRRLLTSATLALAMAAGVTTVTMASASATDRVNECGSSYSFVESLPIRTNTGTIVGDVDVYWSAQGQRNCAIARPVNGVNPRFVVVEVWTSSGQYAADGLTESYTKYAGPVSVYSPGCVTVFGSLGGYSATGYGQVEADNILC